jgi:hypothetical protein
MYYDFFACQCMKSKKTRENDFFPGANPTTFEFTATTPAL